jgi:hypothetical protein
VFWLVIVLGRVARPYVLQAITICTLARTALPCISLP